MRAGFLLAYAATLLLLSGSAGMAQDSLGMHCISNLDYWQGAYSIQMVDDLAYITSGESGLHIMELSHPAHPIEIGRQTWNPWNNEWCDAYIDGHRAYVTFDGGIAVLDVSDPEHPVQIGWLDYPKAPIIEFAHDGIAVAIASEGGNPMLMDVSDPANMTIVSDFPGLEWAATPIGIAGEYLCLAGWGIFMYDISDPANPRQVAAIDTGRGGWSAAMLGNYVYQSTPNNGVCITDVSDPLHPTSVSSFDSTGCGAIALTGHVAIVSKYHGLYIWNVADVHHPVLASIYGAGTGFSSFAARGNRLCAGAGGRMSVTVVDISNPATPLDISSFGPVGNLTGIAMSGTTAFIADNFTGIRAIDVSDPARAIGLGTAGNTDCGFPQDIALRGDYAYLADGNSGLSVYDVRDPVMPQYVQCIRPAPLHNASRIITVGDFAYVVDNTNLLHSFNLAEDPTAPQWTDSLALTDGWGSGDMAAADGYLYLAAAHLVAFSLADPAAPQQVWARQESARSLAITGHYLYATSSGILVMDISDPAHPVEVTWIDRQPNLLTVAGTNLFLSGDHGLELLDISHPTNPVFRGHYSTNEGVADMTSFGPYLLTTSQSHFRVYQCDDLSAGAPQSGFPQKFALHPCYPNPFNLSTVISFSLPKTQRARLAIYDVTGRQVKVLSDGVLSGGEHGVTFDGSALSSGVYFARLEAGKNVRTQKMMLLK